MAEEQQQQQQSHDTGYVGVDGSFVEGFHTRPEFTEAKGIERFKTVPDLAKAYRGLEVKLSQQGLRVPGEGASDEEVAAYRKAIGVPDDVKGYDFKPKEIPEGVTYDEKRAGEMAALFHKHGVPLKVAQELVEQQFQYEVANATKARTAYDNLIAEGMGKLKSEWGSAYGDNLAGIKRLVIAMGADPEDSTLFNDPNVLRFVHGVTGMLSEDAIASMKGVVAKGGTYLTPSEEARAIMRDKNHPEYQDYRSGKKETVAKVRRLLGN
jgi:hypothetical protein